MALKITIPRKPVSTTPLPTQKAPRKLTLPRGPSVLGLGDEVLFDDDFDPTDDGEIVTGEVVVPSPSAALKVMVPGKTKPKFNLPVVQSATASIDVAGDDPSKDDWKPKAGMSVPPLGCSTCHIGTSCDKYAEGRVCYYEKTFAGFEVRTTAGVTAAMEMMVLQNLKRVQIMFLSEQTLNGGLADPQVTRLTSEIMQQMRMLNELKRQTQTITVEASGPATGGILSKIFGKPANASSPIELNGPEGESRVRVQMTRQARMEAEENE